MKIKKRDQNRLDEQLKLQVSELLERSSYELIYLEVNDRCFGNVYLELGTSTSSVRIIQDRGDVFVERKAVNASQWNDCFFLRHSDSDGEYYELLLKALKMILTS